MVGWWPPDMVPAAGSLDKHLTTSPNIKISSVPAQTHPVLSTVVFSGLVVTSSVLFARSATSPTQLNQTSQIGIAPIPSTFYVSKAPPKLGWAHGNTDKASFHSRLCRNGGS